MKEAKYNNPFVSAGANHCCKHFAVPVFRDINSDCIKMSAMAVFLTEIGSDFANVDSLHSTLENSWKTMAFNLLSLSNNFNYIE